MRREGWGWYFLDLSFIVTLSPPIPLSPSFPHSFLLSVPVDYIIRFGCIAVKAVIVFVPVFLLPTRSKGKYYMLLEYLSQFYRAVVPAPLWVRYLSNPLNYGTVFAVLITSVYLMLKGGLLFTNLKGLYRAFIIFLQDQVSSLSACAESKLVRCWC